MSRILGIDFGTQRIGLAVTDPLRIAVSGLTTAPRASAPEFIRKYVVDNDVSKIVIGQPEPHNTELLKALNIFTNGLKKALPDIEFDVQDESYTSVRAKSLIRKAGARKKQRKDKALVDQVSAVLILQEYLGHLDGVKHI